MRPPRVRFTLGTLLFAVAVVAANCWGYRRLTERHVYEIGDVSYRPLPAGVGALPLCNAALVGTWLIVARRLRSLRHGRAVSPRSSSPMATFFSLNFLMLGCLVSLYMPDAVRTIQDVLDVATECAAGGWDALIGEPGETVSWLIFDSLMLGAIISGPPLILSGIGQALARRCAATLPRHRFRAVAGLVSLGLASTGLAIALTPQPFEDEQEIDLEFQVVDQVSGRPITAAFLCMTDPFYQDPSSSPPRALTDAEGSARLTGRFVVSGHRNAFRIMGTFSPWGRWLEVSAAGHRTRRIPLPEVLGPIADPTHPGFGRVALDRGTTPENSFRDLAGIYSRREGMGGSKFKIEPDGRYALHTSECTVEYYEYGYLNRRDGEIELSPIPHPGKEISPAKAIKYRAIEWGGRHYLAPVVERVLQGFCLEALTPGRALRSGVISRRYLRLISGGTSESYLRESDRDKPRTGLPRVPPEVWLRFLADELSLHNEEGSLRFALHSLLARNPREGRP